MAHAATCSECIRRSFFFCRRLTSLSTRRRRIGLLTYCGCQSLRYVSKSTRQSTYISFYLAVYVCACVLGLLLLLPFQREHHELFAPCTHLLSPGWGSFLLSIFPSVAHFIQLFRSPCAHQGNPPPQMRGAAREARERQMEFVLLGRCRRADNDSGANAQMKLIPELMGCTDGEL